MKSQANKKTFTLIEMLIVIVIIGILAAALVPRLQAIQGRARDSKRKVDLTALNTVFNIYLLDNNEYPPSINASGASCPYGGMSNCGVGSTQAVGVWISGLNNYITSLPVDPINISSSYPPFFTGFYSYYYGGVYSGAAVTSVRQTYDLITRLENPSDPNRCGPNSGTVYLRSYDLLCSYTINGGWGDMQSLYQAAPRFRP